MVEPRNRLFCCIQRLLPFIALAATLAGCPSSDFVPPHDHPLQDIPDAFGADECDMRVEESKLTLRRSALDKDFLLSAAWVAQDTDDRARYSKPRIVHFELHGILLNLYGVDSPRSKELIRSFVVLRSSESSLTFRWDMGVPDFDQAPDFEGSDIESPGPMRVALSNVSVDSMRVLDDTLELRQTGYAGSTEVKLVSRLSPVQSSDGFVLKQSRLAEGIGFFETQSDNPLTQAPQYLARRWNDQRGPIVYRIVENLPADVEQTIREGVEYWNRVAGRTLVRVETNGDPDGLPLWREVRVRVVPDSVHHSALAFMQANPLTGEILAAEIYVPDYFVQHGFISFNKLHPDLAPHGLVCSAPLPQTPSHRAALDALREVTAHEVGHTLGLRHNFAGSTETELPRYQDRHAAIYAYAQDPHHPGAQVSSTVMDYLDDSESLLLGAHISHSALPYDQTAIAWGYDTGPVVSGSHRFCTDRGAGNPVSGAGGAVAGCSRFDSGNNPFDSALGQLILTRHGLPRRIAREAALSSAHQSYRAMWPSTGAHRFYEAFSHALNSSSVVATTGGAGEAPLEMAMRRAWLDQVDGLPGILNTACSVDGRFLPDWLADAVEREITAAGFGSGVDDGGNPYKLTAQELESARWQARFVARMQGTVALETLLAAITQAPLSDGTEAPATAQGAENASDSYSYSYSYDPELIDPAWEPAMAQVALTLIGSKRPLPTTAPMPNYAFPQDIRLAAVPLLSPKLFSTPEWAGKERHDLVESMERDTRSVASQMLLYTDPDARQWLTYETELIDRLKAL